MEYRNLGNSELNVSILSLGCLNFGLFCDQETTTEIINTAAAAVYRVLKREASDTGWAAVSHARRLESDSKRQGCP